MTFPLITLGARQCQRSSKALPLPLTLSLPLITASKDTDIDVEMPEVDVEVEETQNTGTDTDNMNNVNFSSSAVTIPQPQRLHLQLQQSSSKSVEYCANTQTGVRYVERWNLGRTIGKGGHSWVKKGTNRVNGRTVALKFIDRRLDGKKQWKNQQMTQVHNEVTALRRLKHPYIMRLLAYNYCTAYPQRNGSARPVILMVLELSTGGELFDFLLYTQKLSPLIARSYFRQLVLAVDACHKAGVVHRDIKLQNMLLDHNYNLKLTDFGLAMVYEDPASIDSDDCKMDNYRVGTRGYQAPEIVARKDMYTKSCDFFSMGVVLFIMLAGFPPFEEAKESDRWYRYIALKKYKTFWKSHRGCGLKSKASDLITRLVRLDPKKRLSIHDMKRHPWLCSDVLEAHELAAAMRVRHANVQLKRNADPVKSAALEGSARVQRR